MSMRPRAQGLLATAITIGALTAVGLFSNPHYWTGVQHFSANIALDTGQINYTGHIQSLQANSGTVCLTNQTGACGTGAAGTVSINGLQRGTFTSVANTTSYTTYTNTQVFNNPVILKANVADQLGTLNYSGHVITFQANTQTVANLNQTAPFTNLQTFNSGISSATISNAGHVSTLPSTTGTLAQLNQTAAFSSEQTLYGGIVLPYSCPAPQYCVIADGKSATYYEVNGTSGHKMSSVTSGPETLVNDLLSKHEPNIQISGYLYQADTTTANLFTIYNNTRVTLTQGSHWVVPNNYNKTLWTIGAEDHNNDRGFNVVVQDGQYEEAGPTVGHNWTYMIWQCGVIGAGHSGTFARNELNHVFVNDSQIALEINFSDTSTCNDNKIQDDFFTNQQYMVQFHPVGSITHTNRIEQLVIKDIGMEMNNPGHNYAVNGLWNVQGNDIQLINDWDSDCLTGTADAGGNNCMGMTFGPASQLSGIQITGGNIDGNWNNTNTVRVNMPPSPNFVSINDNTYNKLIARSTNINTATTLLTPGMLMQIGNHLNFVNNGPNIVALIDNSTANQEIVQQKFFKDNKFGISTPSLSFTYDLKFSNNPYQNLTLTPPKMFGTVDTWTLQNTTATIVAPEWKFLSGVFKIYNPAKTFVYIFTGQAITANQTINLPLLNGTGTLGVLNGQAQNWLGNNTMKFGSGGIIIRNPASTFGLKINAPPYTANATGLLPLMASVPFKFAANEPFNDTTGHLSGNGSGTTSLAYVMDNVYATLLPRQSDNATIFVSGDAADSTLSDGCAIKVQTGTSNIAGATGNGAVLGGSTLATHIDTNSATAAEIVPFFIKAHATGLTAGTTQYFDLAFRALTGGTCTLTNVHWVVNED